MDRTKYIPTIVSLAGAFVACVVTIINGYSNLDMMLIVLAACILFYIAGAIIRMLVVKMLIVPEPEEGSESGEEEGSKEGSEDSENTDETENNEEKNDEQQV
ncbi:MAG: hypothetical protein IJV71_03910 [Lachnospiraceae bacterium]|nr:hypothetical protein [Lachnospiraceae bacterium]